MIEAEGRSVFPAFFDPHVHLRTPGREDEEDVETGSRAAAAGGYCGILAMANTEPTVDTAPDVTSLRERAREQAAIPVGFFACVTRGMEGAELNEMAELAGAGAVGFSDDGLPLADARIMRRALQYQRLAGLPIALHEEDPRLSAGGSIHEGAVSAALGIAGIPSVSESTMIARDAQLAAYEDARIHVQHLSARESVVAVEQAKAAGVAISCEATPHHLTLTDEALRSLDARFKMNPPLRSEDDRQALIEALRSGAIDCVATDHAPHSSDEKEVPIEEAAFGVIGLETAFSALYTDLVLPGVLDLATVVERMSGGAEPLGFTRPAGRARRRGEPRPRRHRGRVGGGRRGLGEPLGELVLRRPQAARPGPDHDRRRPGRLPAAQLRPGGGFLSGYVLLEDGTRFDGELVGSGGEAIGEVVFNTGMTGYQESVTDPSYAGQLITFTYPLIGNYGVAADAMESDRVHARAAIMRDAKNAEDAATAELGWLDWLEQCGTPGITGVDTRALVRRIRDAGAMRGGVFSAETAESEARERVAAEPSMSGADFARRVTPEEPVELAGDGPHVVGIDTGIKLSDHSAAAGARLPGDVAAVRQLAPSTVLGRDPDLVFLANGPGDPAALDYVVETVRGVVGKKPVVGICLGHQLLCRAVGLDTFKLPFGHRGANHPVKDLETGRIAITSQNHGFAVAPPGGGETIDTDEAVRWETDFGAAELTHLNLYDRTVEGLALQDVAGLHGPVPPRGRPRPARRPLPLRPLPGAGGVNVTGPRDAAEVELVARVYEAWNGEPGSLLARYEEFFSADFEWHPALIGAVEGDRTYVGRDAFAEYWRDFTSAFGTVRPGPARIEEAGEGRVLVIAALELEGAASRLPIGREVAYVFDVADGRIARGWSFMSPADAEEFLS